MEYNSYNDNHNETPSNEPSKHGYTYVYDGSFQDNNGGRNGRGGRNRGFIPMLILVLALVVVLIILFVQLALNSIHLKYIESLTSPAPQTTQSPHMTETPDLATYLPELTPSITQRPMPEFDGELPLISNTSNPFPEIYEEAVLGVVGVYNYAVGYSYTGELEEYIQGSGTGFVLSSDGYIATNAHVIADAEKVTVVFPSETEVEAEIIGYDLTTDIAVLKVANIHRELQPLYISNSDDVRVGEFVMIIGDPSGRELASSASFGMISGVSRQININGQVNEYLQTDAAVNPGNSGGPMINDRGEVIGIISAKTITASYDEYGNAISAEGIGFAIPINNAIEIIESLITQGYIQRPGIGISVVEGTPALLADTGLEYGIIVYSVTPDGPGDQAGLQEGDVIVSYDGIEAHSTDEFISHIKSKSIGDEVSLRLYRNSQYMDVVLTIGDLNNMG